MAVERKDLVSGDEACQKNGINSIVCIESER